METVTLLELYREYASLEISKGNDFLTFSEWRTENNI